MRIWLLCIVAMLPVRCFAETFIAHCRDYPPDLYFKHGKCLGAIPEFVTDLFKELGHDIEWIKAPWPRSVKDAKRGKVDLLIRHSMTKQRTTFLQSIVYALHTRELSFYKSPKFAADIHSYDELKRVKIGGIRGIFYSPQFSMLDTDELTLVRKTEQLVGMLEMGRIDVAVTSISHNQEMFEAKFEKVSLVDTFYNPHYISIPKKSKAIRFYSEIANLVMEYRKSGKINQYLEKYGLPLSEDVVD